MANRAERGREQPAVMSRALKPAKQKGTSSAETIRASGHDRANRPYTRLHPDKARQTFTDPLATREPSTQDDYFGFLPGRGIHDIHMNQGNPPGQFAKDNGPWQDGGLLFEFPNEAQWVAI